MSLTLFLVIAAAVATLGTLWGTLAYATRPVTLTRDDSTKR